MGAGGSHPQAAMMPDPWATYGRPSTEEGQSTTSAPPETTRCVPANKGFFNLARGSREGRSRSTTRPQEVTSLIDETLNFFVKATGKDGTSVRQRFTNQNREELRRSRVYWKTRAEEEERLQKTEEETWKLFERMRGFKRKTKEMFEEELTRKVKNALGNSRKEREKAVQEWSNDIQEVIQPEERKREARERRRMEQQDSNSQRRQAWEKIWDPRVFALSPFLAAGT